MKTEKTTLQFQNTFCRFFFKLRFISFQSFTASYYTISKRKQKNVKKYMGRNFRICQYKFLQQKAPSADLTHRSTALQSNNIDHVQEMFSYNMRLTNHSFNTHLSFWALFSLPFFRASRELVSTRIHENIANPGRYGKQRRHQPMLLR